MHQALDKMNREIEKAAAEAAARAAAAAAEKARQEEAAAAAAAAAAMAAQQAQTLSVVGQERREAFIGSHIPHPPIATAALSTVALGNGSGEAVVASAGAAGYRPPSVTISPHSITGQNPHLARNFPVTSVFSTTPNYTYEDQEDSLVDEDLMTPVPEIGDMDKVARNPMLASLLGQDSHSPGPPASMDTSTASVSPPQPKPVPAPQQHSMLSALLGDSGPSPPTTNAGAAQVATVQPQEKIKKQRKRKNVGERSPMGRSSSKLPRKSMEEDLRQDSYMSYEVDAASTTSSGSVCSTATTPFEPQSQTSLTPPNTVGSTAALSTTGPHITGPAYGPESHVTKLASTVDSIFIKQELTGFVGAGPSNFPTAPLPPPAYRPPSRSDSQHTSLPDHEFKRPKSESSEQSQEEPYIQDAGGGGGVRLEGGVEGGEAAVPQARLGNASNCKGSKPLSPVPGVKSEPGSEDPFQFAPTTSSLPQPTRTDSVGAENSEPLVKNIKSESTSLSLAGFTKSNSQSAVNRIVAKHLSQRSSSSSSIHSAGSTSGSDGEKASPIYTKMEPPERKSESARWKERKKDRRNSSRDSVFVDDSSNKKPMSITVKVNTRDLTARTIFKESPSYSPQSSMDTSSKDKTKDVGSGSGGGRAGKGGDTIDLTSDIDGEGGTERGGGKSVGGTGSTLVSSMVTPAMTAYRAKHGLKDKTKAEKKKRSSKHINSIDVERKRKREDGRKEALVKKQRNVYDFEAEVGESENYKSHLMKPTTIKIRSHGSGKVQSVTVASPKVPSASPKLAGTSPRMASLSPKGPLTLNSSPKMGAVGGKSPSSAKGSPGLATGSPLRPVKTNRNSRFSSTQRNNARSKSDSAAGGGSGEKMDTKLYRNPLIKLKPITLPASTAAASSATASTTSATAKLSHASNAIPATKGQSTAVSTSSVSNAVSKTVQSKAAASATKQRKNSLSAVIDKLTKQHSGSTSSPADCKEHSSTSGSLKSKNKNPQELYDAIRLQIIREGNKPSMASSKDGASSSSKSSQSKKSDTSKNVKTDTSRVMGIPPIKPILGAIPKTSSQAPGRQNVGGGPKVTTPTTSANLHKSPLLTIAPEKSTAVTLSSSNIVHKSPLPAYGNTTTTASTAPPGTESMKLKDKSPGVGNFKPEVPVPGKGSPITQQKADITRVTVNTAKADTSLARSLSAPIAHENHAGKMDNEVKSHNPKDPRLQGNALRYSQSVNKGSPQPEDPNTATSNKSKAKLDELADCLQKSQQQRHFLDAVKIPVNGSPGNSCPQPGSGNRPNSSGGGVKQIPVTPHPDRDQTMGTRSLNGPIPSRHTALDSSHSKPGSGLSTTVRITDTITSPVSPEPEPYANSLDTDMRKSVVDSAQSPEGEGLQSDIQDMLGNAPVDYPLEQPIYNNRQHGAPAGPIIIPISPQSKPTDDSNSGDRSFTDPPESPHPPLHPPSLGKNGSLGNGSNSSEDGGGSQGRGVDPPGQITSPVSAPSSPEDGLVIDCPGSPHSKAVALSSQTAPLARDLPSPIRSPSPGLSRQSPELNSQPELKPRPQDTCISSGVSPPRARSPPGQNETRTSSATTINTAANPHTKQRSERPSGSPSTTADCDIDDDLMDEALNPLFS